MATSQPRNHDVCETAGSCVIAAFNELDTDGLVDVDGLFDIANAISAAGYFVL